MVEKVVRQSREDLGVSQWTSLYIQITCWLVSTGYDGHNQHSHMRNSWNSFSKQTRSWVSFLL